jgi:excisionase family DNA binding protein
MAVQLLTIEEAARYLNVSKTTLRRWTKDGRLACSRVGVKGERRFLQGDLDACLSTTPAQGGPLVTRRLSDPLAVLTDAATRGVPRHVCLHFNDRDELWQLFRPYVLDHLLRKAPILYIHEENARSEMQARFESEGYDPVDLHHAGLLRLLEPSDAYLRADTFVPERMIDFMEAAILDFRASGHETVLISGEMTWYLKGTRGVERMIEYEHLLNKLLARYPNVTVVCHYDMCRLNGVVTLGALCSHPHVHFGGQLVPGYCAQV